MPCLFMRCSEIPLAEQVRACTRKMIEIFEKVTSAKIKLNFGGPAGSSALERAYAFGQHLKFPMQMREAQRIVGALCFRYLCFVFSFVFFDWVRVHACNRFISFDLGFFCCHVSSKRKVEPTKKASTLERNENTCAPEEMEALRVIPCGKQG